MSDQAPADRFPGRYRAPALEKGIDILELLAHETAPLTIGEIAQKLDRSRNELFRMLRILEERGFITPAAGGDGYEATDHLFTLGIRHPRLRSLLEIAIPAMSAMANAIGQSCHIAVRSLSDIVVIARTEPEAQSCFTLRIGYRLPLWQSASGAVLLAFQEPAQQTEWMAQVARAASPQEREALAARAQEIRRRGHECCPSLKVEGLTDISCPVIRSGVAVAALTVPFVHFRQPKVDIAGAVRTISATARTISESLSAVG